MRITTFFTKTENQQISKELFLFNTFYYNTILLFSRFDKIYNFNDFFDCDFLKEYCPHISPNHSRSLFKVSCIRKARNKC